MASCHGFGPVANKGARVLILGTLPSVESLKQSQYYAKKQNGFWKIMGTLMGAGFDRPYDERLGILVNNKIALWDVCEAAEREGSLDSNIQNPKANDFASFFKAHEELKLIAFNGQPASRLFKRYVDSKIKIDVPKIVLPSTSPAFASMKLEEKGARWKEALEPHLTLF